MDNLSDRNVTNGSRTTPFATILQAVLGFVRWLTGFFTLTEEERLKAGINVNDKDSQE
jgi:hypothetical protein